MSRHGRGGRSSLLPRLSPPHRQSGHVPNDAHPSRESHAPPRAVRQRALAGQDLLRQRPRESQPRPALPNNQATQRTGAPRIATAGRARVPAERLVYRVIATVMQSINEDDGDVHLVLQGDDGSKMIAKAPEPACAVQSRDRAAINKARLIAQSVTPQTKMIAIGVGFLRLQARPNRPRCELLRTPPAHIAEAVLVTARTP
jgi:hypothetical protein